MHRLIFTFVAGALFLACSSTDDTSKFGVGAGSGASGGSEDFFDVARYPHARFTSTRVEKGPAGDRLKVTGNLTLRNVTRPLILEVRVLKHGDNPRTQIATVGFIATGKLKRSDFGLGAFVPQVGDEITLQVTSQGAEAKAYGAHLKAKEAKEQAQKQ